ncbi:MAG: crossover junction endodeoxyribonuclease RuvC, partial [Anaerolineae bacterium]
MLALGIDPGIGITGYGFVRERDDGGLEHVTYGVIKTPPEMPLPERLQAIYAGVDALVREFEPDSAAVEKLLFGRNVTTAMAVGQARGVTLLALVDNNLSIDEYTPATIKQSVAGYGNANKGQVQDMVRLLLNLDDIPRPDDAADALAVAITHLYASR